MNIIFPISVFYPASIGGPNYTLLWHTIWLKQNNIQPIIITTTKFINKSENIVSNKWVNNSYGYIIYLNEPFLLFPIRIIIRTLLKFKKADVVHLNSLFSSVSVYLIFITWLFRKKVVMSPRGELLASAFSRRSYKKRIVLSLTKPFLKRATFHSTSVDESKEIKNYFGNVKIVEQYNFISTEYANKPLLKNKNIGFLGRINPIKNVDLLLKAAKQSSLFMNSDSKIIIAGDARLEYEIKYLKSLNKWIDENDFSHKVQFIGHVQGEAKKTFLSESYFLFLPSKSENFGNSVVEALSHSTPVVASKGTPWKILEEKNAGYWIDADINCLAEVINKILLLSDPEYYIMSNNALELVKSEFDVNSTTNKWKEIYKTIANG